MATNHPTQTLPGYALPAIGTTLTVLSGLSFLWVCMLLPMVGPAGAATTFAVQNARAFTMYVMISLVLSLAAIVSKTTRRAIDGSPLPLSSMALCGLDILFLMALYTNLLSV